MHGALYRFFADDHARLGVLLNRARRNPGAIDIEPYDAFREGLLRHIAMEENTVMPTIARLQHGRQADDAARIRLDHGAIVSLLVPPPSRVITSTLHAILLQHNHLEEQEDGLYAVFDRLAAPHAADLLEQLRSTPAVPVRPYRSGSQVMDAVRRAVQRAGYDFIE